MYNNNEEKCHTNTCIRIRETMKQNKPKSKIELFQAYETIIYIIMIG